MKRFATIALVPLALAGTAFAGKVSHNDDGLRFVGKGEKNRVNITDYGESGYVIVDRAGGLRVGGDCFRDTPRRAQCPAGDPLVEDVRVSLGRGADRMSADIRPGNRRDSAKGITAWGGAGNDRLVARARTSAFFRGEDGNDVLIAAPRLGSRLISDLNGGPGNDVLRAPTGNVDAHGGPGDDDIRVDGPNSEIFAEGGAGDDLVVLSQGGTGSGGRILGGDGDDRITSGAKFSSMAGGDGNDTIDAANSDALGVIHCGDGPNDTAIMGPEDRFGVEGNREEEAQQDPALWGCENVVRR